MCRVERKRHRATSVLERSVFEQPAHLCVAVGCALGLGCLVPVGKRKGCIRALDTSVLWNQYCMIVLSVVWGGRAMPLLWRVIEHKSASVSTHEYMPLRTQSPLAAAKIPQCDAAGRPGQCLLIHCWSGAGTVVGTGAFVSKRDVRWHGVVRFATRTVAQLYPKPGEAVFYKQIGLREDGTHRCNRSAGKSRSRG